MFNQDEGLKRVRAAILFYTQNYGGDPYVCLGAANELVDAFVLLDRFMSRSGSLPGEWNPDYGGQMMEGEVPMDDPQDDCPYCLMSPGNPCLPCGKGMTIPLEDDQAHMYESEESEHGPE